MSTKLVLSLALTLICALTGAAHADDLTIDRGMSKASGWKDSVADTSPSRWDFDFGDTKALLRRDGTWQIEGAIKHHGFRCGNYRFGIRFGSGNPDCLDVAWLTEPLYTISQKFCNNARRYIVGDGFDAMLAENFDRFSCAERLVLCRGLCQTGDPGAPEYEPPAFGGYR